MNKILFSTQNTHIKGVFMDNKIIVRKKTNPATIAIIVLSVLLLASVVFGATLAYFNANADVTGTITLGNPVNINITQGGASVSTLTFDGTAMPGSVYNQPIGVSIPADTSNALLRAKLQLTDTTGATSKINATTNANWIAGEDDYYSYNGVAKSGDAIDFVTKVIVPTSLTNEDANKVFTVSIIVEAIQEANNAARDVWTSAPADWLTTYAPAEA